MFDKYGKPKFEDGEKVTSSNAKYDGITGKILDCRWNNQDDCFCYEVLLDIKTPPLIMINEIDLEKV